MEKTLGSLMRERTAKVDLMLKSLLTQAWSNGMIAAQCGVSDRTVGNRRKLLEELGQIPRVSVRIDRNGRAIDTEPIGAR